MWPDRSRWPAQRGLLCSPRPGMGSASVARLFASLIEPLGRTQNTRERPRGRTIQFCKTRSGQKTKGLLARFRRCEIDRQSKGGGGSNLCKHRYSQTRHPLIGGLFVRMEISIQANFRPLGAAICAALGALAGQVPPEPKNLCSTFRRGSTRGREGA